MNGGKCEPSSVLKTFELDDALAVRFTFNGEMYGMEWFGLVCCVCVMYVPSFRFLLADSGRL